MKKLILTFAAASLAFACSHANEFEVKNPNGQTDYDASAGYWKNTGFVETKNEHSQYQRCMITRTRGMEFRRAQLFCEQFVLAGQPDLQRPEPSPCLYCGYGYWR